MSGPWEKYQKAAPADGPWTKYARPAEPELTGAEAMRARGLSSPDPAAANAAADPRSGLTQAADAGLNFSDGAFRGLTGLLGMPSDFASMGLSAATGRDVDLPLGGDDIRAAMAPNRQGAVPINEAERRAGVLGEYVGPGLAMGAAAGIPGMLAAGATDTAAGLAAGEVREQGGGPVAEIAAALVAGGVPLAVANKVSKASQTRAAIDAVPDIDDLKGQAGALYDAGRAGGMTAPGALTQGLDAKLTAIVTDAGLIAPDGTLAPKYADIGHAMKMAKSYAGQDMTPEQMQQVRKAIQSAAQSADPNEARIGTKMLREFDRSIRNPLVPEFKEGDALYARAMRGEEVNEAIQIAQRGRRTPNETAISNEFQNLVRRGIRGDLTYPPELEAAIEAAANGGTGRQIAATIGKAAPTSVVGGGVGFGVPASVVTGLAGPVAGAAAGSTASGVGLIARLLANRLARGDARTALATALNGAPLPEAQTPEAIRAAIAALLGSTGAQATR